jgi:hypothetical protein
MSAIVSCPECRRALQVPEDFFGQTVQCPDCKSKFVARAPSTGVQSGPSAPTSAPTSSAPSTATTTSPPAWEEPPPRERERRRERYEEDEDDDEDRRRRLRRPAQSNQGAVVLTLGIVSVSMAVAGLCCGLMPLLGVAAGITGGIMGHLELARIRAGEVSSQNRAMVLTGWILSLTGAGLSLLWLLLTCLLIVLNLSLQNALGGGRF